LDTNVATFIIFNWDVQQVMDLILLKSNIQNRNILNYFITNGITLLFYKSSLQQPTRKKDYIPNYQIKYQIVYTLATNK